jgi:hypothetical protein
MIIYISIDNFNGWVTSLYGIASHLNLPLPKTGNAHHNEQTPFEPAEKARRVKTRTSQKSSVEKKERSRIG